MADTQGMTKNTAAAAPAAAASIRIVFDSEVCTRCTGDGTYPSAAWQGVCLGCAGEGRSLTRAGKRAKARYMETIVARTRVLPADLTPGDQVRTSTRDRFKVLVSVTPDERNPGRIRLNLQGGGSIGTEPTFHVLRAASEADRAAARASVARMQGWTLVTD